MSKKVLIEDINQQIQVLVFQVAINQVIDLLMLHLQQKVLHINLRNNGKEGPCFEE